MTDVLENRDAYQRNKLHKWISRNLMKFSVEKCKVQYLGWNDPTQLHRLGPAEQTWGFPVDYEVPMSQHCALGVQDDHILSWISKGATSRLRNMILPLY